MTKIRFTNGWLLSAISILIFVAGCSTKPAGQTGDNLTFRIVTTEESSVLDFARRELSQFLSQSGLMEKAQGPVKYQFTIKPDPEMKEFSFSAKSMDAPKGTDASRLITLTGHSQTDAQHAVYTLLEEIGWKFEITGPEKPVKFDLTALDSMDVTIDPAIGLRGPRLYVNFPMDLSGYSQEDALEYIRNNARMRHNFFAIHTYPGQWYEYEINGKTQYGGHFFYGQIHDIPDVPVIKNNISNKKTFCIPEIEPYFDDPAEKSKRAVAWMNRNFEEADKLGMHTHISIEPRSYSTDISQTIQTAELVLEQYPMLDTLEITTQETGTWYPVGSLEKAREYVIEFFGEKWMDEPMIAELFKPDQPGLDHTLGQMGHNLKAAKTLQEKYQGSPRIHFGLYCSIPWYHKAYLKILREELPDEIGITLLAGHGAYRDYKFVRDAEMTPEDIARTMIIGWHELDGGMYTLQNSISGNYEMIKTLTEIAGDQVKPYGLCPIHWRLTEVKPCARYTARAMLEGPIEPDHFYQDYAAFYGIEPWDKFASAMKTIDTINEEVIDDLSISFCFLPVWGNNINFLKGRQDHRIEKARNAMESALDDLRICAQNTSSEKGKEMLAFLDNRIRLSIIYFRAFEKAYEVVAVIGDKAPEELTEEQKAKAADIFNQSLLIFDQYMELHVQNMPDRGAEGNLISFYWTSPEYIKRMREKYCGVPHDTEATTQETIDAPPMPITQN